MLDERKSALWQALGLGPEWILREELQEPKLLIFHIFISSRDYWCIISPCSLSKRDIYALREN